MAIENVTKLRYRINESFASNFDELVNIDVSNRKSDVGFSEDDKLMVKMRPGTVRVGDVPTGSGGSSKEFFHTDSAGVRRRYKGFANKLWYLNGTTWTDIGTFTSSDTFEFSSVKLPRNSNGSVPTTYTTSANGAGAEKVAISASDPAFGSAGTNVGKVLMVMSDPNASQAYRGAFGTIIDNDGTYYTLLGSGITNVTTGLSSGATYKVYETTGDYLQVCDGASNDRYFDGVTEHSPFAGMATLSLRTVRALSSTQFVSKQVPFANSMWSYSGRTAYFSAGEIGNPFFHNFEGARTVPTQTGTVSTLFEFKNRLVVGGANFIYTYSQAGIWQKVSSAFGIKYGSIVDLGEDAYYLSTDGKIRSLSETITGNVVSKDVGKPVSNYTKDFVTKICAGFDGNKFYVYGQKDANTVGDVVVFDITWKFWSTYSGLSPASLISEDGVLHASDALSGKSYRFDKTVTNDMGTKILQRVANKEIDLGDPFMAKSVSELRIWLENFTQKVTVSTYVALPGMNCEFDSKTIDIEEKDVSLNPAPPIGEGIVGGNILGGDSVTPEISYPNVFRIPYKVEKGLLWKVIIEGYDGSPFYLNGFDVYAYPNGDGSSIFPKERTV